MKAEMNVRLAILSGVLILGISSPVLADEPHAGAAAGGGIARPGLSEVELPGLPYDGLLQALDANAGKPIETSVGWFAPEKTISSAELEKIQTWVKGYRALRAELKNCNLDKDPGSKQLAALLDLYTEKLHEALFGKKKDVAGKGEPKEADEKTFLTLTTQIEKLLKKRGEILKSDAHKPFATEAEKKTAAWLDNTLSILFGSDPAPEARKAEFLDKAHKDSTVKEIIAATDKAVADLSGKDVEVCKLEKAPSSPGSKPSGGSTAETQAPGEERRVAPATGGNKEPGEEATTPVAEAGSESPDLSGFLDAFNSGIAQLSEAQAAAEQRLRDLAAQGQDALTRFAQEIAANQARQFLDDQQDDDENDALAAEAIKALGAANNDQPAIVSPPAPPAPITPPSLSTGSSQPSDPGQQFPPDPGQQMPPGGGMPGYAPPPAASSTAQQPMMYMMEPSRFAEEDYDRNRNSNVGQVDPMAAGQMAANQLLMSLRMGQQQYPGMTQQQGAGTMANRLGATSSTTTSTRTNVQSQGTLGSIQGNSGSDSLAIAPNARGPVPDDIRGQL